MYIMSIEIMHETVTPRISLNITEREVGDKLNKHFSGEPIAWGIPIRNS